MQGRKYKRSNKDWYAFNFNHQTLYMNEKIPPLYPSIKCAKKWPNQYHKGNLNIVTHLVNYTNQKTKYGFGGTEKTPLVATYLDNIIGIFF